MSHINESQLGQSTVYISRYAPELLYPVPRSESRAQLAIGSKLPFRGVDIWTAYELSWLDHRGKPWVAWGEFHIPIDSPNIIESKSFKLYLNSFNQTPLAGRDELASRLVRDLSAAAGAPVVVHLFSLEQTGPGIQGVWQGECLDELPISVDVYTPQPSLLQVRDEEEVSETLYSHLLKSNCPVTGQPDWASVRIDYRGQPIDRQGLLKYIVSFREHQDFHEHCVERMFTDIMARCEPDALSVYARYTRRGGLDINPLRTTGKGLPSAVRLVRQ